MQIEFQPGLCGFRGRVRRGDSGLRASVGPHGRPCISPGTAVKPVSDSVAIAVPKAPGQVNRNTTRCLWTAIKAVENAIAIRIIRTAVTVDPHSEDRLRAAVEGVYDPVTVRIDNGHPARLTAGTAGQLAKKYCQQQDE
ncbi:MAG: hypothetical protein Tsb0017_00640 [Geothermobacteraceae bacterium]